MLLACPANSDFHQSFRLEQGPRVPMGDSRASLVFLFLRHRHTEQRFIATLVLHWTWAALAYAAFFSKINPAAWLFSVLFLTQAGLLLDLA
jgi:hypothetical protein